MPASNARQVLRIIGGTWRSRRIHFPGNVALRPTPDRVRETLFNWLMPVIEGARCLDLFAGSGVLGLEALSRGAREAVFVDNHRQSIDALRNTCEQLAARQVSFYRGDAVQYLQGTASRFDIVFLDPPYRSPLLQQTASLLQDKGWLAANAYIYVEHAQEFDVHSLPPQWQLHRQKQAGQVCFSLYTLGN